MMQEEKMIREEGKGRGRIKKGIVRSLYGMIVYYRWKTGEGDDDIKRREAGYMMGREDLG